MKRGTKKLLKQLRNESPKVRYEAVLALGRLGDSSLIDPLDDVANLDDNHKVRHLAGQAVSTLHELERRRALRAQGDMNDPIAWPELAHERMLAYRETAYKEEEQRDWAAEASKKLKDLTPEEKQALKDKLAKQKAKEEKRAERRKRRGYRMILWLAATIGIIGLTIVLWYAMFVTPPPSDRAAVLRELENWATAQQGTVGEYQTLLSASEVECSAVRGIDLSERPKWTYLVEGVGLTETRINGGRNTFEQWADDLSRADPSLLTGLEGSLITLEAAQKNLEAYHDFAQQICNDLENLDSATWVALADQQGVGGNLSGVNSRVLGVLADINALTAVANEPSE